MVIRLAGKLHTPAARPPSATTSRAILGKRLSDRFRRWSEARTDLKLDRMGSSVSRGAPSVLGGGASLRSSGRVMVMAAGMSPQDADFLKDILDCPDQTSTRRRTRACFRPFPSASQRACAFGCELHALTNSFASSGRSVGGTPRRGAMNPDGKTPRSSSLLFLCGAKSPRLGSIADRLRGPNTASRPGGEVCVRLIFDWLWQKNLVSALTGHSCRRAPHEAPRSPPPPPTAASFGQSCPH